MNNMQFPFIILIKRSGRHFFRSLLKKVIHFTLTQIPLTNYLSRFIPSLGAGLFPRFHALTFLVLNSKRVVKLGSVCVCVCVLRVVDFEVRRLAVEYVSSIIHLSIMKMYTGY